VNISLDYDDTFTRDKSLWSIFAHRAKGHGHDVRFVTFRKSGMNNEDIEYDAKQLSIPILYTAGKRKRQYCYEQGFMVHVWIDDMPEIIVEDHGDLLYPENLIKLALEDN
jgi:hypothetical protein